MKLVTNLFTLMACAHAMFVPHAVSKFSTQKRANSEEIVPLQYIVVLKKGQAESAYKAYDDWIVNQFSAMKNRGDLPDGVSDQIDFFNILNFMGYTGHFPPTLLDIIRTDPVVDFVEKDQVMEAATLDIQDDAPWGIARISQRPNKRNFQYRYDVDAGEGVTAYVVDSGIKVEHPEFLGRAKWGPNPVSPNNPADVNGHGTLVAGIIGSETYGVAKNVELVAVGILNAAGKVWRSAYIIGIAYVANSHQTKVRAKTKFYKGAVMNLSVSGSGSTAVDLAVEAAVDAGVHVVVAAGNKNQDACNFSPARAKGVITVGFTDYNDHRAYDSNYGTCVHVHAPGVDILSTGIHLTTATDSGSSFAAPHVAGILASFMSAQPDLDSEFSAAQLIKPADLKIKFLAFCTKDKVSGLVGGSPNLLAYNGSGYRLEELWKL